MNHRILRTLGLAVLGLLAATAAGDAVAAAKLITMRNGRVLKVLNVSERDGWVTAQLAGENEVGFPREFVVAIEEDPLGRDDEVGESLNIVTGGRDVGGGGAFRSARPAIPGANVNPLATAPEPQEDPPREEPDPSVGGFVSDPDAGQDPNAAAQPLNPTGGLRNRRLNRVPRAVQPNDN